MIPLAAHPEGQPRRSHEFDVRNQKWYSHFQHSVFTVIETAHYEGAKRVLLVGITPELDRVNTNAEFPAILQDLHFACTEKKAPFFKRGEEVIPFTCIEVCRVAATSLEKKLSSDLVDETLTAVIMSCAESDEGSVLGVIKKLNDTPQYQGRVKKAGATAEDMYGRLAGSVADGPSAGHQAQTKAEREVYIIGVRSISKDKGGAPDGFLHSDTNKGMKGKFIYVAPRYGKREDACTGFEFVQHSHGHDFLNSTGDLAQGTGGTYRYIKPLYDSRPPVTNIWWSEKKTQYCTGDINKGRGGRFLYLCWSYD